MGVGALQGTQSAIGNAEQCQVKQPGLRSTVLSSIHESFSTGGYRSIYPRNAKTV